MKKYIGLLSLCIIVLAGCGQQEVSGRQAAEEENIVEETDQEMTAGREDAGVKEENLVITVGGQEFTAEVEDNETTKTFLSMLPLTLNMNDFNGNEKVISLYESIRKEDPSCPGTIYLGDIMCYGSDQLVLFYDTFSTVYNYVKIGHVDDTEEYAEALGTGSVEVTFSLK